MKKNCLTHPEEIAQEDCPCELLAYPFDDGLSYAWDRPFGLEEIDHVSEHAMSLSCLMWAEQSAPQGTDPVCLPLGDGRCTQSMEVHASTWKLEWPIGLERISPVDWYRQCEHQLLLVLRNWVEEPQDERLARLLEGLPGWKIAAGCLRESLKGMTPKQWSSEYLTETLIDETRVALSACGLPATRGTARYLLSRVDSRFEGADVTGASRGILVTSFALAPKPGSRLRECEMVSQITSVSPWDSDPLQRQAAKVARGHVAWWKRVSASQFEHGNLRRFDGRPPDELTDLLLRYRAGEIGRARLEEHVVDEARRRATTRGEPFTPLERAKALRALNARLLRLAPRNPLR